MSSLRSTEHSSDLQRLPGRQLGLCGGDQGDGGGRVGGVTARVCVSVGVCACVCVSQSAGWAELGGGRTGCCCWAWSRVTRLDPLSPVQAQTCSTTPTTPSTASTTMATATLPPARTRRRRCVDPRTGRDPFLDVQTSGVQVTHIFIHWSRLFYFLPQRRLFYFYKVKKKIQNLVFSFSFFSLIVVNIFWSSRIS